MRNLQNNPIFDTPLPILHGGIQFELDDKNDVPWTCHVGFKYQETNTEVLIREVNIDYLWEVSDSQYETVKEKISEEFLKKKFNSFK